MESGIALGKRDKNMNCIVCGEKPPNEIVAYEEQLKWMVEHRRKSHPKAGGFLLALYTNEITKEAALIGVR